VVALEREVLDAVLVELLSTPEQALTMATVNRAASTMRATDMMNRQRLQKARPAFEVVVRANACMWDFLSKALSTWPFKANGTMGTCADDLHTLRSRSLPKSLPRLASGLRCGFGQVAIALRRVRGAQFTR
jgi:hypothetical protein